ncbi:MAG TPA: hypothetical protein RMH99_31315 [Sandaracinaceae bacterium LLY-WYZ-13_1]|nr:hypothetical protein [Sandaracinaceae bacterium LLY-WYZ-13_1]
MKSERHDPTEGYRKPAKPSAMPVTVLTVRHNEYSEPAWVARLRAAWRRWTGTG